MDKDEIPTRTTTLTSDEVQQITKNPKNIVYQYEHDTVDRVKSVEEVKYNICEAKNEYDHLRKNYPELCDNACRRKLMLKFADFSKTHPFYFKMVTNRDATPRDFQMAYLFLNMRKQVELGNISEEQATLHIKEMVLNQCKTGDSHEEWKRKQKQCQQ